MGIVEVLEISGGRSPLIIGDLDVYPQLPRITGAPTLNSEEPDYGARPGTTREESSELRDLRRRNRLLEQENEVLRRAAAYLSQANLPGKGSTRS